MRASIDMNEAQVEALDMLAKRVRRSHAALIRSAIDDFLARHRLEEVEEGFGLWGRRKIDGLDYQDKARGEWQARCSTPVSSSTI